MLSAIFSNLDQAKILSSGNGFKSIETIQNYIEHSYGKTNFYYTYWNRLFIPIISFIVWIISVVMTCKWQKNLSLFPKAFFGQFLWQICVKQEDHDGLILLKWVRVRAVDRHCRKIRQKNKCGANLFRLAKVRGDNF